VKEGWQRKQLGEVCEVVNGGTPKTGVSKYWGGNHLWITPAEMGKRISPYVDNTERKITDLGLRDSSARMLPPHSVILSSRAPIGHLVINTSPMATNQGCKGLVPSNRLDHKFLYYYLSSIVNLLNSLGTGATFKELSGGKLKEVAVPFPPFPEQQRIVGILDQALEGIATAKVNAEKNLQNARALFESHLQSVFTQRGKGWKMEKLDALTELARGHNPPKSKFSREAKPGYVRFYQIRDGGTDDYAVYVPDTPQLHKMKKDDIMMVAYRHVGRAFRGVEGAFNVALCKISNARRDLLDDDYLFHMIPSQFVRGELLKRSERSLIPSMSIEHLRELRIPLPPLLEQQRIVELINRLSTKTKRLATLYQRKITMLDAFKRSLLHQAFTGQL
jgi:type I restriction enzyme S subunit